MTRFDCDFDFCLKFGMMYAPLMRCPYCQKETFWRAADGTENPWRPFCSERCQLIDLGKWADEDYRLSQPGHDDLINFEKLERELEDEQSYVN